MKWEEPQEQVIINCLNISSTKNNTNNKHKIIICIGSFGRVKIAKNKITGKYNAIKQLKKAEIIKLKQVDHIINEIKILTYIDHPFLV